MNAVDETSIRDQLQRAVSVIDPAPPQLDMLRARAVRRKRTKRMAGGVMVLAVAGAAAAIIATVLSVAPGGNSRVQIATPPSHQSLVHFAKAHGGLKVAGPFAANPGWYGAFTTKRAIVVATYTGNKWHQDGAAVTSLGAGKFVSRLGQGPQLAGASTPSIYVRVIGGDVSYFGSVLRRTGTRWRTASFGTCGHDKLCYPGNSEPYGHPVGQGMVSISNTCTPNCAAGTDYRVTWQWRAAKAKFVATSERAIKN